jgi:O-antigen/teichoic acid export membrane protein
VLFLIALGSAQSGTLSGLEAFKRLAQINFWSGFVRLPVLVVGVWKWGLLGAIWALVIDQAVLLGLSYWGVRKEAARSGLLFTIKNLWSESGLIWRFSVPALLTGILYGPTHWVCNALLVNHRDGYAQMGQFNAANQWFWALLFLPGVLGQVALPMLCERLGQNNTFDTRRVMIMSVKINAMVTIPLVVCGSLVSPFIMGLYGVEFREGWPTMVAVLLTGGLIAVQMPIAQTISAVGRMWVLSIMNLAWATCFVGLTWLLVGWGWGALGLAVARLASHVLHTGWLFAYARTLLHDTNNGNHSVTT